MAIPAGQNSGWRGDLLGVQLAQTSGGKENAEVGREVGGFDFVFVLFYFH